MLKLVGWLMTTAVLAFLIWQTSAADPLWPRAASGFLLVIISFLAGMRLSSDSSNAYMQDLQRLNKYLADQNQELQDANSLLLNQVAATVHPTDHPTTLSE
jgi:hypothetical protein